MKNYIFVVIAAIVIFGFLWIGNRRTDALMSVGECVEKSAMEEPGFQGSVQQAWETFAEQCAKQISHDE